MTLPPTTRARTAARAERPDERLARDPRYGHYARIPGRVCRCLEHFGLAFDRARVAERLGAYYLFVGVADDAIDAGSVHNGAAILRRLVADDAAPASSDAPIELAVDALRRHFGATPRRTVRATLEQLYAAVVREREAATLAAYVAARKSVGRLTAEASYLLIRPLVAGGAAHEKSHEKLRRFLTKVGEVGCLLDSVLDLGADARHGLLGFRPTRRQRLRLAARTLFEGAAVMLRHPRLLPLFLEAAADTFRDRLAARDREPGVKTTELSLTLDSGLRTHDSL